MEFFKNSFMLTLSDALGYEYIFVTFQWGEKWNSGYVSKMANIFLTGKVEINKKKIFMGKSKQLCLRESVLLVQHVTNLAFNI